MHRGCGRRCGVSPRRTRSGILFLGALREILVISFATAIVLVAISNAKTVFRFNSLSQDPQTQASHSRPVLNFGLDRQTNSLVVHSWPGEFDDIQLETGKISTRHAPRFTVSAAVSEWNSTSIFVSQWADDSQVNHQVFILRDGELMVSEKLDLGYTVTGDVRISADGSVAVVVGHEGLVTGWDLKAPEPVRWEYHLCASAPTNSLSPDGRRMLVADFEGQAMICDVRTGEKLIKLPRFVQTNRTTAWSADGRRLAMGAPTGEVTVFDTTTGETFWNIKLDFLYPRCMAFSEQGNLLAVGGFDKQIRVWDLSHTSEPPVAMTGESSVVHNLVFAHADSVLISGSSDGTIREWSIPDKKIIRQLR